MGERQDAFGRSLKEIQERLYEAINTLAMLPDRERRYIYHKLSSWPDTLKEKVDVMALALERLAKGDIKPYDDLEEDRPVPSPEAITRMDEALPWLTWLSDREFLIVTLRAKEVSWGRIAARFGRSDTTVQTWHNNGVHEVMSRLVQESSKKNLAKVPNRAYTADRA